MSRLPQSNFIQGGFYHVFNRGNRKQNVFLDTKDYNRYLTRLKEYKGKHNVSVIAYCLMPNHIHLLLRQNGPQPVSQFIQRTHTAYTMYFNNKYKTTGHVFTSPTKAKMVTNNEYLLHLSRYIHTNPKSLVSRLPSYPYSSYKAFIDDLKDDLAEPNLILNFFKSKHNTWQDASAKYKDFVQSQEEYLYKIQDLTFKH